MASNILLIKQHRDSFIKYLIPKSKFTMRELEILREINGKIYSYEEFPELDGSTDNFSDTEIFLSKIFYDYHMNYLQEFIVDTNTFENIEIVCVGF